MGGLLLVQRSCVICRRRLAADQGDDQPEYQSAVSAVSMMIAALSAPEEVRSFALHFSARTQASPAKGGIENIRCGRPEVVPSFISIPIGLSKD
jgi:hypothetical protein